MQLYFLALDGGPHDDHIFSLNVESNWDLSRLREALERHYSLFEGKPHDQIKVWVLTQYLDAHTPDPSDLDAEMPAYKEILLIRVEAMMTIASYFQEPFKPGEDGKIHLIVKLGPDCRAKQQPLEATRSDALLLEWQTFWAGLWGRGEEYLKTNIIMAQESEHGVFDTMSTDPAFNLGNLCKLLIRKEWKKIWGYAVEKQRNGTLNFITIGHSGIGKTLSLYYFLVMRVALGLSTFFQTEQECVWLFHKGGVVAIPPSQPWKDVKEVNYEDGATWALVDSNQHLDYPGPILWRLNAPIFIVQASSPFERHWRWAKDHGLTAEFYVKPFSLQEMLQGNSIQAVPANEALIRNFHIKYGPSARNCYFACGADNGLSHHDNSVNRYIESVSLDTLIQLISARGLTPWYSDQGSTPSHYSIIIIEPVADNPLVSKANIITRTVMRRLWKAQHHYIQQRAMELSYLFLRHPESSTTAAWLFEGFVHDLLDNGIDQPLYQLNAELNNANTKNDSYSMPQTQPTTQWKSQEMEYTSFTGTNDQLDLCKDYYYVHIPIKWCFPTYESFTYEVTTPTYQGPILDIHGNVLTREAKHSLPEIGLFTIFKIIMPQQHDVNESGLVKLLEISAYNRLKAIAIRYVAVFPPYSGTIESPVTWRGKVSMFGLHLSSLVV